MRTLLLGDIIAAARALMFVQGAGREALLDVMITEADAAYRFHKRMLKPHPKWGNGSLMARANIEPQVDEPLASDADYLQTTHLLTGNLASRHPAG